MTDDEETNYQLVRKAFTQALDEGASIGPANIEALTKFKVPLKNVKRLLTRLRKDLEHEEYYERKENTKLIESISLLHGNLSKLYGVDGENKVLRENIMELKKQLEGYHQLELEYFATLGEIKLEGDESEKNEEGEEQLKAYHRKKLNPKTYSDKNKGDT